MRNDFTQFLRHLFHDHESTGGRDADAKGMFAGPTIDLLDDRKDYGEARWVTYGLLDGRMVALVWTSRGDARHIISMRKANEREQKTYKGQLDRPG